MLNRSSVIAPSSDFTIDIEQHENKPNAGYKENIAWAIQAMANNKVTNALKRLASLTFFPAVGALCMYEFGTMIYEVTTGKEDELEKWKQALIISAVTIMNVSVREAVKWANGVMNEVAKIRSVNNSSQIEMENNENSNSNPLETKTIATQTLSEGLHFKTESKTAKPKLQKINLKNMHNEEINSNLQTQHIKKEMVGSKNSEPQLGFTF